MSCAVMFQPCYPTEHLPNAKPAVESPPQSTAQKPHVTQSYPDYTQHTQSSYPTKTARSYDEKDAFGKSYKKVRIYYVMNI